MATNNLASSVSSAISASSTALNDAASAIEKVNKVQSVASNPMNASFGDITSTVGDLQNAYQYAKNNQETIGSFKDSVMSGDMSGAKDALTKLYQEYTASKQDATEEEKNYLPEGYEAKNDVYETFNTKSKEDEIKSAYDDITKQAQDAYAQNVATGEENLAKIQRQGEQSLDRMKDVASKDYQDMIDAREAVEANNGNRDGIGHSQYGIAEQTEANQRAAIAANIEALKRNTARQVADLRAKGDYKSIDALLANTKEKLKTMYTDAMRVQENLYKNYVYQVGLQREDEATQRAQDEADLEYQRNLGMTFIQKGLVPNAGMLDAMGITADQAKAFIKASKASSGGSGGSGGSGSSGSGSGDDETGSYTGDDDTGGTGPGTTTEWKGTGYSNKAAKDIFRYAETSAKSETDIRVYARKKGYESDFSENAYTMVIDTAVKKMESD